MERREYELIETWEEPSPGSVCYRVMLTNEEAKDLQDAIDWFDDAAGDNYGFSIPRMSLSRVNDQPKVLTGMEEVTKMLKVEEQYYEDIYKDENPVMKKYLVDRSG